MELTDRYGRPLTRGDWVRYYVPDPVGEVVCEVVGEDGGDVVVLCDQDTLYRLEDEPGQRARLDQVVAAHRGAGRVPTLAPADLIEKVNPDDPGWLQ